jgi:hypothetical protein
VTTSGNSDDRDELDDPALRSMRAVWISMRDEAPPAGGLAELLAAARSKAEEMRRREPWWRRVFAVMQRPPMLALATVVVLLGGAIVIGARREAFESMPKVEMDRSRGEGATATAKLEAPAERAKGRAAGEPAAERAEGVATGTGAAATESPAPPADDPAPPKPAPEGPARRAPASQGPVRPEPKARPPAENVRPQGPGWGTGTAKIEPDRDAVADQLRPTRESVEVEKPPPAPPPPPPASPGGAKGARAPVKQDLQIADDAGAASAPSGAPALEPSSAGTARDSGSGRPRGPTVTQLAKQSATAAARGDCAAVRAIAGQMRKLDAAFHKSHVEGNAAVKRCVSK